MSRDQEVKERILQWEQKNGKKLENLTRAEWIKAAQQILALTAWEAEEYLTYLQMEKSEM